MLSPCLEVKTQMFFKLALSNVKKSVKDYAVYFLTLSFGVCLFYMFNSIDSQQSMLLLSESQQGIIKSMIQIISGLSVFVSIILGFLIIYANRFLIRRRKKELGLYMLLGMEKGRISRILVLETFIISLISLGVGLLVGVFASQGLSVVSAKMFEVNLSNFHFVFSIGSFLKTILYFGIIFLVIMLFNVVAVSKYKLIDLLNASKRNENLKVKNPGISVLIFLISFACIGYAYRCIIHNGMMEVNFEFWQAIFFGSLGTLLFFMSLSGFLLKVLKANKRVYLKGLNMFVLRQINSKINTNFVSMTVICIMLLVTIGALASGIGMASAFSDGIKEAAPFDASIRSYYDEENNESALPDDTEITKIIGDKLDEISDEHLEISLYLLPIKYGDIIRESGIGDDRKFSLGSFTETGIAAMKLSDYNSVLKMQKKQPVSLGDNEYLFNCNYDAVKEYYEKQKYESIMLDGKEYKLYKDTMFGVQYETSMMLSDAGTFVLPDKALEKYKPVQKILNINYKGNTQFCEEKFKGEILPSLSIKATGITAQTIKDQSLGIKVLVSYIAIYIGLVFLITSVAVLALQQLSESSDNIERYALLREIGAEERMINKALFAQIFIYFMMPLALAIVHSVVGLYVANRVIIVVGRTNIVWNTVVAAIIFLAVYGAYFLATFLSCKGMIREKSRI